ncbi:ATP-dependent nuclease [Paenibacillus sp. FJAT-27812]|uniref:ATP-dependent nuclease n=1 Tax=Paenibacillus sp. FJAT-27812 TaxID=1684143 RepID=UPI0007C81BE6|nr:AAA family ATPase [Paenibacillus sp. FJAT-27812]
MHISSIQIKNFRLLHDVDISLDDKTTVIVGRNNSGKTSLAELFRRLFTESSPTFMLEDLSLTTHDQLWHAFRVFQTNKDAEKEIHETIPKIEIKIRINYKNAKDTGLLSDFIIDLNLDCNEAHIIINYQLEDGKLKTLFDGISIDYNKSEAEQKILLFRFIKDRLPKLYKISLYAIDPNDSSNQKKIDWKKFQLLIQGSFINAQRELGDMTIKERDVLGKILEGLFNTAKKDSTYQNNKDQSITHKLKQSVEAIQDSIDVDFNAQLTKLLPAFSLFGYPGLPDPNLLTETLLNVESLLKDHTKVRYLGINGVHLPESYNGLGARNLIFILLKLLQFYKDFIASTPNSICHLIYIEEPEAHLHPQMQEVFISQLNQLAAVFTKEFNNGEPWPVQFIVTSHSSHIANKADFKAIRYFLSRQTSSNFYSTKIKDLNKGAVGPLKLDIAFLQQYMTLTKCDLFFADKAILIEGTTERILLPKIIDKLKTPNGKVNLGSQYLSIIEVGGAYAHNFFNLINFLELRTLIITDIDSIDTSNSRRACMVSQGDRTSNACKKKWFNETENIKPKELILKSNVEKIRGYLCIAYQVPEKDNSACGRSFEDSFMLANPELFEINADLSSAEQEEFVWALVQNVKKVEFALTYAINKSEWNIPRYIKDGLAWLEANDVSKSIVPIPPVPNNINFAEVAVSREETND